MCTANTLRSHGADRKANVHVEYTIRGKLTANLLGITCPYLQFRFMPCFRPGVQLWECVPQLQQVGLGFEVLYIW
jgi:hypothetical protein